MTKPYPSVSVVIPTHNRKKKLIRLINSIQRCKYPQSKIEIVVVDDASTDKTFETVKETFPEIKILRNNMELFPSACRNLGIKNSQGEYIFLVDDDNVLDENAPGELVKVFAKYNDVGIVGPIMYYYKNPKKVWCAGARLYPPIFIPTHISQAVNRQNFSEKQLIECDYVPNTFMIKRIMTKQIGFFDETLPIGWEEADFALRIKKKHYKVVISTAAKVFHDVSLERDVHVTEHRAYWRGRNRIVFYRKHAPIRCFFILIDILGFIILLLEIKQDVKTYLSQYIKGVKNGLKCNFNS